MFTYILEDLFPLDYFSNLIGISIDQEIISKYIAKHLPKI